MNSKTLNNNTSLQESHLTALKKTYCKPSITVLLDAAPSTLSGATNTLESQSDGYLNS